MPSNARRYIEVPATNGCDGCMFHHAGLLQAAEYEVDKAVPRGVSDVEYLCNTIIKTIILRTNREDGNTV